MKNKNETLVYVQVGVNQKGEAVYKWLPLKDLPYKDNLTLDEYISQLETKIEGNNKEITALKDEISSMKKIISSQDESINGLKKAILEVNEKLEREGEIL